jgi:histidinol dehydrogenase
MPPRHLKSPSAKAGKEKNTNGTSPPSSSSSSSSSTADIVRTVIDNIRQHGDSAVRQYSEKFDSWSPESFKLSPAQIQESLAAVPEQTIKDIKEAQGNVRRFAEAQRRSLKDFEMEMMPGVYLGQRSLPVERVGAYVNNHTIHSYLVYV